MSRKQGAIDLSMNTIVLVIIAISVLGFALFFVSNSFSKVQEKAFNALDAADLKAQPTEEQPFIVSPSRFEIGRGKSVPMEVAVLNTELPTASVSIALTGCDGSQGISTNIPAANTRPVKLGDKVGWEFSVRASNNVVAGDYFCTVKLSGLSQERFQDINVIVK